MSRLKRRRIECGLTLGELGELTGLTSRMLDYVERGQRSLGPLNKAKVARALEVPIGDLFDLDDRSVSA